MAKRILSRDQLAKFLSDHDSIKAFEEVFDSVSEGLPAQIEAAGLNASVGTSSAQDALAQLIELAEELKTMLGALPQPYIEDDALEPSQQVIQIDDYEGPVLTPYEPDDDLRPILAVGNLAEQNTDSVDITGGALTGVTVNKVTITAPATAATLTIADGKTLTASNTITIAGTDGSTLNVATGGTLGSSAFTATTSGNWTPTDASGAALSFAVGTAGVYIIIGKFVFVSARVVYPATADVSQACIGGFPATVGSVGNPKYNATGVVIGGGTANKIGVDRGTTTGFLYTTGNTAATNAGQTGQTLDFSICFMTI